MKYIKVCYMCPICAQGYFFDKSSQFSTECPKCHVEMVCVEEKNTTTEIEERESRRWENGKSAILIECPYCHSMNTSKIGTVNRDRKSTRLNSSHTDSSRMPSSA